MGHAYRYATFALVLALPLFTAGCWFGNSVNTSAPPPSNPQQNPPSTQPAPNGGGSAATTTPSGNSGQGTTAPGNSGSTSDDGSSPVVSPSLVLYPPVLTGENLVQLTGRAKNAPSGAQVSLFADDANSHQIASANAAVANDGTFHATFNLEPAGDGAHAFYFGAALAGAEPQGVQMYLNVLPLTHGAPVFNGVPIPVYQSEQWIAPKTNVPLELPSWLPQMFTTASPSLPYISATAAAKSVTYTTSFYETPVPFAVNDSDLYNAIQNQPDASIATITGESKNSAAEALQQVSLPAPPQTNGTAVDLGSHLTGYLYSTGSTHLLRWQEGLWSMQVTGPADSQNILTAKQVVSDLNLLFLPPTSGNVQVWNETDSSQNIVGTRTVISYARNNDVYTISTQNHLYDALHIAASMLHK